MRIIARAALSAVFLTALIVLNSCGRGSGSGGGDAAAPVGRFAFVANQADGTVSIYALDGPTGALRHNGYVLAGATPISVSVDPSARFAYIANFTSNNI